MALTDAEKHLVFEVFGIPNATDVLYIDGRFGTGKTDATGAILVSQDEILSRIDALAQHLQDRLSELLAEWKRVSIDSIRIMPNAANEGVDVNPARTRRLIRERVRKIVPVIVGESVSGGNGIPVG